MMSMTGEALPTQQATTSGDAVKPVTRPGAETWPCYGEKVGGKWKEGEDWPGGGGILEHD